MREIKFRAWGKNSKEFLSPDGKTFGLTLKEIQNIEDINIWEFQQFTGLKDKNGKDIYEGDIVKYKFYMLSGVDYVIFREGKFELKNDYINSVGFRSVSNVSEYCEVIGNIFENKDLLNK